MVSIVYTKLFGLFSSGDSNLYSTMFQNILFNHQKRGKQAGLIVSIGIVVLMSHDSKPGRMSVLCYK